MCHAVPRHAGSTDGLASNIMVHGTNNLFMLAGRWVGG